ncbi:hypothetical protein CR513_41173, partial [Mucuna pruriens]
MDLTSLTYFCNIKVDFDQTIYLSRGVQNTCRSVAHYQGRQELSTKGTFLQNENLHIKVYFGRHLAVRGLVSRKAETKHMRNNSSKRVTYIVILEGLVSRKAETKHMRNVPHFKDILKMSDRFLQNKNLQVKVDFDRHLATRDFVSRKILENKNLQIKADFGRHLAVRGLVSRKAETKHMRNVPHFKDILKMSDRFLQNKNLQAKVDFDRHLATRGLVSRNAGTKHKSNSKWDVNHSCV